MVRPGLQSDRARLGAPARGGSLGPRSLGGDRAGRAERAGPRDPGGPHGSRSRGSGGEPLLPNPGPGRQIGCDLPRSGDVGAGAALEWGDPQCRGCRLPEGRPAHRPGAVSAGPGSHLPRQGPAPGDRDRQAHRHAPGAGGEGRAHLRLDPLLPVGDRAAPGRFPGGASGQCGGRPEGRAPGKGLGAAGTAAVGGALWPLHRRSHGQRNSGAGAAPRRGPRAGRAGSHRIPRRPR